MFDEIRYLKVSIATEMLLFRLKKHKRTKNVLEFGRKLSLQEIGVMDDMSSYDMSSKVFNGTIFQHPWS